jgi:hypothetical protein
MRRSTVVSLPLQLVFNGQAFYHCASATVQDQVKVVFVGRIRIWTRIHQSRIGLSGGCQIFIRGCLTISSIWFRMTPTPFSRFIDGARTLSITTFSITTLSITTLSITTLSKKCLYVTLSINDNQHKWHSIMVCHYAECRVSFIFMPNVIMLSVFMVSVVAPYWGIHHFQSFAYFLVGCYAGTASLPRCCHL